MLPSPSSLIINLSQAIMVCIPVPAYEYEHTPAGPDGVRKFPGDECPEYRTSKSLVVGLYWTCHSHADRIADA